MAKPCGSLKKRRRRNDKKHSGTNKDAVVQQSRAVKSQAKAILTMTASSNPNPRNLGPFSDRQRILVVGDGDFSFSLSLAVYLGGKSVVATSYDSKVDLKSKYPDALLNCDALKTAGVQAEVHFGVDATKLEKENWLKDAQHYQAIVFNFPHLGGATEVDVTNNQKMLRNFFFSARNYLDPNCGQVLVSLRNTSFYKRWKIQDQAAASGFQLRRTEEFNAKIYSAYKPQRTHPAAFRGEPPSTIGALYFIFTLDKTIGAVDTRNWDFQKPILSISFDSSAKAMASAMAKKIVAPSMERYSFCQLCGLNFSNIKKFNGHINSAKHAKKLKALKKIV